MLEDIHKGRERANTRRLRHINSTVIHGQNSKVNQREELVLKTTRMVCEKQWKQNKQCKIQRQNEKRQQLTQNNAWIRTIQKGSSTWQKYQQKVKSKHNQLRELQLIRKDKNQEKKQKGRQQSTTPNFIETLGMQEQRNK
ncbi:hypothetical protein OXYTRIMIC_714 [Oxytricha trifallax]|uniref:Uncharacterized protein n=1 Tax=Oxytricha trifallax TaxID=1172189 RepID=A0A073HY82_9SPIT|nr:hypothetical protein OXYTRIMIC_714 [Oxytricha trifallax]